MESERQSGKRETPSGRSNSGSCAWEDPYCEASSTEVQVLQDGAFLSWKPTGSSTAIGGGDDDTIRPEETRIAAPTTFIANEPVPNSEFDREGACDTASEWSSFNVCFTGSTKTRFKFCQLNTFNLGQLSESDEDPVDSTASMIYTSSEDHRQVEYNGTSLCTNTGCRALCYLAI